MIALKIFVALILLVGLILLLKSIKICEGGKIMQGCGRLLFPWSFKIKIEGGYCCKKCFMRDYELYSTPPKRDRKPNLFFSVEEEYANVDLEEDEDGENSSRSGSHGQRRKDKRNVFERISLHRGIEGR